ncbi:MAG: 5-formyltetrahydrofolate cyclo-ligase [Clostridia bacterium]|nr:5-formyltetrahydrofolate cyclo-ligase [Clostridia bacterium]
MIKDIRPLKMRLRNEAKQYRSALSEQEKERLDKKIANKLLSLWSFREADTIFAYMSTGIEIGTDEIIAKAWELGKKVAVPRCIPGTRHMQFYYITDYSQLENGSFGVREPIPDKCIPATDSSNAICVVPALVFDKNCYRLGYGKGYYDRFLSGFEGSAVGLCYESCRNDALPHGKYDKSLDLFITETRIYTPAR